MIVAFDSINLETIGSHLVDWCRSRNPIEWPDSVWVVGKGHLQWGDPALAHSFDLRPPGPRSFRSMPTRARHPSPACTSPQHPFLGRLDESARSPPLFGSHALGHSRDMDNLGDDDAQLLSVATDGGNREVVALLVGLGTTSPTNRPSSDRYTTPTSYRSSRVYISGAGAAGNRMTRLGSPSCPGIST